ncbi:MAG: aspartate carbamoyltransferase [Ruminiclostridium sp.]|nr:aspartate carbamoyltransferase [Ruminiclostridium sp.]
MSFSHLIDLDDYSVPELDRIVELGTEIKNNPSAYSERCKGRIMATLFFEPSTRTQMSFQTAMLRLGGSIIGFDNPSTSSVAKGENLKDTTKVVSSYSDIMVIRHPLEGSVKAAALTADCPVINAGDGGHLHPTQTLTDLVTLKSEKGRLDNLTVGLCGDLRYGRTVHSLLKALSKYKNNKFVLISSDELALPSYIKDILKARGCEYKEVATIEEAIGGLDVLYMTRIQKERFASEEEYLRQKNIYVLDTDKMKKASADMIVLHPLPRVDEITIDVDDDPRALYFRQAANGVYARMALIISILEGKLSNQPLTSGYTNKDVCCHNPKCITATETYLPHAFRAAGDILECEFCDERILLE